MDPVPESDPALKSDVTTESLRKDLRARHLAPSEAQIRQATELKRETMDGALLLLVAMGFGALGIIVLLIGSYVPYHGAGFSPYETMSIFAFSAAGVMGLWGMLKISSSM